VKFLRELFRLVLGTTFIFSGFVKGIDPLGSTYKFIDYFGAFGADWANKMAFTLAILLAVTEFGIGIALVLNYRIKLFSWFTLLFMSVFFPLTLWIALVNPVSDCGCFGDALVISNWETFYKNIVLVLLSLFVLLYRHHFKNKLHLRLQNSIFLFFIVSFLTLQFYSYNHLPIIDFRPYKIGQNISEGMEIPEGAPEDEYRTEFFYKNRKTGKIKEFNEQNYPWQDTVNWVYDSSKSILEKTGYHPPIHDFTIENRFGEEISDFYLYDPGYTFILVSYNLELSNKKNQEQINNFAQEVMDKGINFICLTASTEQTIENFTAQHNPPYEFFFCDEITLKTIIRSNPGLVLTQEGTILNKWHWKDIPDFETLSIQ
jgi:uncharacterized membrane protein YphA (DoxX/SURF4 family)